MSTVVVTLTDYGSDFRQFLKPYFFQKLVGELANRVVCEYLDTLCTASAKGASFQLTPDDVASMRCVSCRGPARACGATPRPHCAVLPPPPFPPGQCERPVLGHGVWRAA